MKFLVTGAGAALLCGVGFGTSDFRSRSRPKRWQRCNTVFTPYDTITLWKFVCQPFNVLIKAELEVVLLRESVVHQVQVAHLVTIVRT